MNAIEIKNEILKEATIEDRLEKTVSLLINRTKETTVSKEELETHKESLKAQFEIVNKNISKAVNTIIMSTVGLVAVTVTVCKFLWP